ncbi:MAG TPA: thiamine-phosphate kinase [Candidatus Tectomicrobia bacterium]|jgi:thiamine-monophosphate kinase
MRVDELGEFALIARLQRHLLGQTSPQIIRSVGDDCAVLRPAAGMDLLLTTDTQEEGVHFRCDWSLPEDIGWRCLAVNVSDIAAMGGSPLGAVVALSLPAMLDVAFVEALYDGMQAVATRYDCPVIGGNISRSIGRLSVTITVLGEVPHGQSVCRAGAQVGDEIWVTGSLGGARAGLEVLRHPEAVPGLPTEGVLTRYRRPHPRLREAQYLRQHACLHSLLDISDGLSSDLRHICEASGVGAQLEAACIPIAADVQQIATALQADVLAFALHGGEDFELCLTAPPGILAPLQPVLQTQFCCPLVRVGTIQSGSGVALCLKDGTQVPLVAGGYDHFRAAASQD